MRDMKDKKIQISAFVLHILAMLFMLSDHLWATIVPGNLWMNCLGRIAYPIFAFMIVEGFFHTKNLKKYILRLFVFAILSEIPFNLMNSGTIGYPYHQNVLWTFLISLCCIIMIEKVRKKKKRIWTVLTCIGVTLFGFIIGLVTMVDYHGAGVFIVLLFYFFHERKWYNFIGQFVGLYWINVIIIRGMDIPVEVFGYDIFIPTQGFALLALIPIWLYQGEQGPHNKLIQYIFYAFYPVHILILSLLAI